MPVPHPLAVVRFARGLTQQDLAAAAGVHRNTIQRIENGEPTTLATAQAIADALGYSTDEVFPPTSTKESSDIGERIAFLRGVLDDVRGPIAA